LERVVGVVAGEEEGDTEGTKTTELSIALLQVAQLLDELLDGDVFVVRGEVRLIGYRMLAVCQSKERGERKKDEPERRYGRRRQGSWRRH
jgi:hypothetical protein